MEDRTFLTLYLGAWFYQLLSLIALSFAFLFLALPTNNKIIIFMVAFFFLFAGGQYVSWKRKKELENEQDDIK